MTAQRNHYRRYRPEPDVTFTLDSLEDALDSHQAAGLIRGWRHDERTHGNTGTRKHPLYWVELTDRHMHALATPWEAHAFLCGLASARQAMECQGIKPASMVLTEVTP